MNYKRYRKSKKKRSGKETLQKLAYERLGLLELRAQ